MSAHDRRQRVLAALTDMQGEARPWLSAEEISYSPFCDGLSVRQVSAALSWFKQRGFVAHRGAEWKLTPLGVEASRSAQ